MAVALARSMDSAAITSEDLPRDALSAFEEERLPCRWPPSGSSRGAAEEDDMAGSGGVAAPNVASEKGTPNAAAHPRRGARFCCPHFAFLCFLERCKDHCLLLLLQTPLLTILISLLHSCAIMSASSIFRGSRTLLRGRIPNARYASTAAFNGAKRASTAVTPGGAKAAASMPITMPRLGISAASNDRSVQLLSSLLNQEFCLYIALRNAHWGVQARGSFRDLHLMFKEAYEEADATYDELAERMRTLGAFAAIDPHKLNSTQPEEHLLHQRSSTVIVTDACGGLHDALRADRCMYIRPQSSRCLLYTLQRRWSPSSRRCGPPPRR